MPIAGATLQVQTPLLISTDTLLRRRDLAEVIGASLVAKAEGVGHRRAAELEGVPLSTVRGWLRRFAANAEAIRVLFTVVAHDLDPMLAPTRPTGTAFTDGVEAIGVAARAASIRLAPVGAWLFASTTSGGRLLSNEGCPGRSPSERPASGFRSDPLSRPRTSLGSD